MAFRPFFVGAEDSKAIFILDLFLKKKYYFLLTHEVLLGILWVVFGPVSKCHFGCKLTTPTANPQKLLRLSSSDKRRRFCRFSLRICQPSLQKHICRQAQFDK